MLTESKQVAIEESYSVTEAIKAQADQYHAYHALLELIAPALQSEAISLIVKLQHNYAKVIEFKHDVYRTGTTEEGDYKLALLDEAWMKLVGIEGNNR